MERKNLELIKTKETEKELQQPLSITLDQYLIKKAVRKEYWAAMKVFGSKNSEKEKLSAEEWDEIFLKY